MDGQNPAPLRDKGSPSLLGIYRGIIQGFLGWCEMDCVHPQHGYRTIPPFDGFRNPLILAHRAPGILELQVSVGNAALVEILQRLKNDTYGLWMLWMELRNSVMYIYVYIYIYVYMYI